MAFIDLYTHIYEVGKHQLSYMQLYNTQHAYRLLQNIRYYHFIYFIFSPSLLMNSCLGNIQCRASTGLVTCFIFLGCFTHRKWLFNPHPLNQFLFSFRLKILELSLFSSALARQWSFTGAPVFHCFHFHLLFLHVSRSSASKESWWRDSIPWSSEFIQMNKPTGPLHPDFKMNIEPWALNVEPWTRFSKKFGGMFCGFGENALLDKRTVS